MWPVRSHGRADVFGFYRILKKCRELSPALIHCHDSHSLAVGSRIGAILGVPIVMTRRVLFPIRHNLFNMRKYSRCSHVVAVSEAVARECRALADDLPVSVIHSGVKLECEDYDRLQSRRMLGVGENCFAIGTVCHFTGEKNFDLVLTLAQRLSRDGNDVKVVCVGPMGKRDTQRAKKCGNLIAAGHLSGAARYYRAFDAYVSAAVSEGLGTALVDAVVRDIPSVALDSGGARDIFPEGSPFLVDSGDTEAFLQAVERLVHEPEECRKSACQIGILARKEFDVSKMTRRNLAIYEKVLSSTGDRE